MDKATSPSQLLSLTRAEVLHAQLNALNSLLGRILPQNEFYRQKLVGAKQPIDADDTGAMRFQSMADFQAIPFTTREEIEADQLTNQPYGTNLSIPATSFQRVHQTSGSKGTPVTWLDTGDSWNWWKRCWRVVLEAAGVTEADRVFVPFSFGPFIGFWGAYEAAMAMGAMVLPAGGMSTSARLAYLQKHGATVLCCTPTYALRMVEVAQAEGVDLAQSPVRAIIVAGEPGGGIESTRHRMESGWGARVFDHVGMTEIGAWGFEVEAEPGTVFVNELEFVAEVVDPESGTPMFPSGTPQEQPPPGTRGELVLTNLGRWESPLIRYRTGDLVELSERNGLMGLKAGVIGRTDDMIHVRGVNVFPSALENVVRRFEQVAEFQIFWDDSTDAGTLLIRLELRQHAAGSSVAEELAASVEQAIRDAVHVRPRVEVVTEGSLPRSEMKARRFFRGRGNT
ncbi:MAG: phenylacetate--CoA ligase family protein [Phycisphaerae bacterium]